MVKDIKNGDDSDGSGRCYYKGIYEKITGQMQNMDNDAARVIRDITKTPIYVSEGKGEINVCEAVKDMINESRLEGKAEGRVEGKAEGKIQMLKELVKDGTLSVVKAAAKANMIAEQFKKELDKEV